MKLSRLLLAGFTALTVLAGAQRPGGTPPGGPGGPGGPRRFEMRMPSSGMNGAYLNNPAVQKELHMTPAQIAKVKAALPQPGEFRGSNGNMQQMMRERLQKMDAATAVLNGPQKARLKQITLQSYGAAALMMTSVQKDLGLNAGQVKQIAAANERISKERQDAMQKMGRTMPGQAQDEKAWRQRADQFRAQAEKWRKELAAASMKVLTPTQKAKWTAMQGKPFNVEQLRMRRGGPGGPGRPGGPGGRGGNGGAGQRRGG